jgi:hypothetical protein
MQQERDRFNRELREYEAAQGFTPVITQPSDTSILHHYFVS